MNKKYFWIIIFSALVVPLAVVLVIWIFGKVYVDRKPLEPSAESKRYALLVEDDITKLDNAIGQYINSNSTNKTKFVDIPLCNNAMKTVGNSAKFIGTANGNFNLNPLLMPQYTNKIPQKPGCGNEENTCYYICQESNGQYKVGTQSPALIQDLSN